MNKYVYNLPSWLKIRLGRIQTIFNKEKREAARTIDKMTCDSFEKLNSNDYKKNLERFFRDSSWNASEIEDFISWLYKDEVVLVHKGSINKKFPYVIGVVKNEADKLTHFFEHYNKIGDFNFIFIDNGSEDSSIEIIKKNGGTIYQCLETFSTRRKLAWLNKVYSTIPNQSWTILLDADELLVYDGYEDIKFDEILQIFDREHIDLAGAVMIDMFSNKPIMKENYIKEYVYFENNLHEEKSVFCNSVYGGIREREFKMNEYEFGSGRVFLVKKHPVIKKTQETFLIHCHYIYPFKRNYDSTIYFGLLHYKVFDSEIDRYRKIAKEGSYGNGSVEYKSYLEKFQNKEYEDIFQLSKKTIRYTGTNSLEKIECLKDIRKMAFGNVEDKGYV